MTAPKKSGVGKTAPKNRQAALSLARKAAFDVLVAVERGRSHSDDLLRGKAVDALSPPDRHLATALVLGVLRWQIRLDHQLQALLSRPKGKLDPEVMIALRLGAFQILHMDRIPARAAIDESVELAKQAGHRFASGMVNAVLRKLGAALQLNEKIHDLKGHGPVPSGCRAVKVPLTGAALAAEGSLPAESPAELAQTYAHPAWIVERWTSIYGIETARALCRHGQIQPVLTIRIQDPQVADELAAAGIQLQPSELLTAARTVVSGDVTASAAFHEGRLRLQDEGSQLIAELAAANTAQTILDACAAPGNKTLILAERNPQARILACESSPQRFEQLRQRLVPLGERVECRLIDATTLGEHSSFDLVLADVPCSGTGTLGRNPEIRHRLRPEDLARQAERQFALLLAALRAIRPGGRVIYSTCSLEPEENEQVVAAALAQMPNARQISLAPGIQALLASDVLTPSGAENLCRCLTAEGALRLIPGVFLTDGFYLSLLQRNDP
jgi:16S rRNA (cytosine967-C5)-methyltransferase